MNKIKRENEQRIRLEIKEEELLVLLNKTYNIGLSSSQIKFVASKASSLGSFYIHNTHDGDFSISITLKGDSLNE